MAIETNKATVPRNLLGIDRKIAYANRKYHSGWMWTGVTKGLAGIKFSVSPNKYGSSKAIEIKVHRIKMKPNRSLNE